MGHCINKMVFSNATSTKRISKICDEEAIREGDYHTELYRPIRFVNTVLKDRETADKWIDDHDKGFYDSLAVRYKDGRRINWLVKIEYHV